MSPTAHSSWPDTATTSVSVLETPGAGEGTIVQPVPFHRSIRVRLSPVAWSTQEPTANRRDEPGTPVTAAREQCRPATSGAGTMLQPPASRCIVKVPFEVLSPTAQTSVAENARTSERWFSSAAPPSFGLGTTDQAWPFQCSIKVFGTSAGSSAEPTAHALEPERTLTALSSLSWSPTFGLGILVQAEPSHRAINVRSGVHSKMSVQDPTAQKRFVPGIRATSAKPFSSSPTFGLGTIFH